MNREEKERVLDRLLDSALAAQGIEPRPGLEARVTATLRAQPRPRPWWRWAWVPALAVVTVVAIGLQFARRPQQVRGQPNIAQQQPPAASAAPKPAVAGGRQVLPHRQPSFNIARQQQQPFHRLVIAQVSSGELPRQQVFPSPVPLTPEEQTLLAFVNGNRAQAVLIAQDQQAERERVQRYFETGVDPGTQAQSAPNMR